MFSLSPAMVLLASFVVVTASGVAGGDGSASAGHWSFQPVVDPAVPEVADVDWPRSEVDAFVLARLEEAGLRPAPEASRRDWLRRVHHVLTGLPPTMAEVEAFVADQRPEAERRVVDRLLASPRFGERWARHWLDLARYSDTKGYVYDREQPLFLHSWAYRDWVVRSFNQDLPYDRFLKLQIAADQLAGEADRQDLAAMGFLTLGRRFLNVVPDIIDDRIDVLMRTTQALSVACARCHDHKHDPIPTEDYYSLYGVLDSSVERAVPLPGSPVPPSVLEEWSQGLAERERALHDTFRQRVEERNEQLRVRVGDYLAAVLKVGDLPGPQVYEILGSDDVLPIVVRQWRDELRRRAEDEDAVFATWRALQELPEAGFAAAAMQRIERCAAEDPGDPVAAWFGEHPPSSMAQVAAGYTTLFGAVRAEWRALRERDRDAVELPDPRREALRQVVEGPHSPARVPAGSIAEARRYFGEPVRVELARLQTEIERWNAAAEGAPPHALILEDRAQPRTARVFERGDASRPGRTVPRRFLRALGGEDRGAFQHGSGRRELAEAIAEFDNPLTARVWANRVWQRVFGRGLVATPSDFGTHGEAPSHPQLLDWLASRLMEDGWSTKALLRRVLCSATFRQSCTNEAVDGAADPEGRLLWRMPRRRLDWESWRDSLLFVCGELDLGMGGRAVPADRPPFRRSLYSHVDRSSLPDEWKAFDFANPDEHTASRSRTTVPQQALYQLNAAFVIDRARHLADRIASEAEGSGAQVRAAYRHVLRREPSARQLVRGIEFLESEAAMTAETSGRETSLAWQYGYGEYDAEMARTARFHPLPHYTGSAWQGGSQMPDAELGWVQLTAGGGHSGNDLQHAAIRRWTAPRDGWIDVQGVLRHPHAEGEGIRGRVVSSRHGRLGEWELHQQSVETVWEGLRVRSGDSLDFCVDFREALGWDSFDWAPVVRWTPRPPDRVEATTSTGAREVVEPSAFEEQAPVGTASEHGRADDVAADQVFDAAADFSGPPVDAMSPLARYVQVLLLSAEFSFVE